jgi:NADPH2:quinone reductase
LRRARDYRVAFIRLHILEISMKAVALTRYLPISDANSLFDVEIEKPIAAARDLLVRVLAVSVNPVDTKVRSPKDKVESSPRVLGWDAAGIIAAVGDQVMAFKPGDEVYYAGSIERPGCNSEYQLVDERIVACKPASLDFAQAAALPLTAITAWELMFERMRIGYDGSERGRNLLIIGGAGGVGSMAIQLGKLAGLTVIATASRNDTIAWCRELGADHVIDHRQPLQPQLDALGITPIRYIVNLADSAAYWTQMGELIAPQGRIGLIVEPSGPLPIGDPFKLKSVSIHWELMFTRAKFQTDDMIEQQHLLTRIAALIDAGKLRGTARQNLGGITAENLRTAHTLLESGQSIGKIVLAGW